MEQAAPSTSLPPQPSAPSVPGVAAPPQVPPSDRLRDGIASLRAARENGTLPGALAAARVSRERELMASNESTTGARAGAGAGAGAAAGAGAGATAGAGADVDEVLIEAMKVATVDIKPADLTTPSPLADAHPFLHYYGMLAHQANMLQVQLARALSVTVVDVVAHLGCPARTTCAPTPIVPR